MEGFRLKIENKSLRNYILCFNVFQVITGLSLTAIGIVSQIFLTTVTEKREKYPLLWWFGLVIILLGFGGFLSALNGRKLWMKIYLLTTSLLTLLAYLLLIFVDNLQRIDNFGVTTRIYGFCQQEKTECRCRWYERPKFYKLKYTICKETWIITTLYLIWLCLLILSLSIQVLILLTTAIGTFCLHRFNSQKPQLTTTAATIGPLSSEKSISDSGNKTVIGAKLTLSSQNCCTEQL